MHGKSAELQTKKENALSNIKKGIKDYLDEQVSSVSEIMKLWAEQFGETTKLGAYGKAQKIVNMSFKYLYCLKYFRDTYKERFKSCHMPLDSIMLEWIYRYVQKDIIKSCIPSWSALDYSSLNKEKTETGKYTYNYFVEIIKNYCGNEKFPLQLDFEYWNDMRLLLAAEDFFKVYNGISNNEISTLRNEIDNLIKKTREGFGKLLV